MRQHAPFDPRCQVQKEREQAVNVTGLEICLAPIGRRFLLKSQLCEKLCSESILRPTAVSGSRRLEPTQPEKKTTENLGTPGSAVGGWVQEVPGSNLGGPTQRPQNFTASRKALRVALLLTTCSCCCGVCPKKLVWLEVRRAGESVAACKRVAVQPRFKDCVRLAKRRLTPSYPV